MSGPLLRVAVIGASGAVGQDLVELLEERRFPIQELVPVGHEASLGSSIEFLGHSIPMRADAPLVGLDLVFTCTPPGAARDWIRDALRAEVPCIDVSGVMADRPEVPLGSADQLGAPALARAPLVTAPSAEVLLLYRLLRPIHEASGIRRAVVTFLSSASGGGRPGIEALQGETVALFNQQETPEGSPFERPLAFDCLPAVGPLDPDGVSAEEQAQSRDLERLLGAAVELATTKLRVPIFSGLGASLAIWPERPASAAHWSECLAKTAGVQVREGDDWATTRDASGQDDVTVSRVRPAPGQDGGLLLWAAADPVRLAALNAVRLAEARLRQAA